MSKYLMIFDIVMVFVLTYLLLKWWGDIRATREADKLANDAMDLASRSGHPEEPPPVPKRNW